MDETNYGVLCCAAPRTEGTETHVLDSIIELAACKILEIRDLVRRWARGEREGYGGPRDIISLSQPSAGEPSAGERVATERRQC